MFTSGKAIRMERLMNRNTGKTVIVPMDHGVTVGPIEGLIDLSAAVDMVAEGGANAVIGHLGLPRSHPAPIYADQPAGSTSPMEFSRSTGDRVDR